MQVLKTGSTGKLVTYLQKKLGVDTTGTFDAVTNAAVLKFQTKKGLVADGIVGGNTWTQIYLATETPRTAKSKADRHNNIRHLHPTVRAAVVKTYVQLQAEGIPFKVFEAFRHPERQSELYAQGRTKPGSIVTYAKPWSSYHQYGLAVDLVLMLDGEWSWNTSGSKAAWWARMNQIGTQEGLMRLDFEVPHLQLAGTSSNALRQGVYPAGGDKSWYDNFMAARE
ncbi:peptidoglycan-binding protein [Mucilaginibacter myungsuensis]|uniref:Peptidoglycan-binding protein n=1 Tax=Mucilaginibacter myungsuensis TaxID=649104 RepID=A0A929L095_9SPHI|nr:peptidoglycan-binding protein [Mucilaginibacter myungsuensis]MBE9664452.1 peptidoglycan-binding protein [Mucilaginibacter myungsuensis]MDN3601403.1 peptidoglycan-binding protein [Mucilaginibacter myungsuensis]